MYETESQNFVDPRLKLIIVLSATEYKILETGIKQRSKED